jgi:hypothetical protein
MNFSTIELPPGSAMWRAAPYMGLHPGNGTASATKHSYAWFGPAREDVAPYALRIQPHLGNKISIIREYNVTRPLKLINLGDVNTVRKLSNKMQTNGFGNVSNSFVIENGKVKRVNGTNQFQSNKKTANKLRSFLLVQDPNVHGWFHPEMEKPRGGYQKAEFMVFSPTRGGVKGKGAQGSGIPSPIRHLQNSRRASPRASPRARGASPRAPRASPRQASPRARGASPRQSSRVHGAPPLANGSRVKKRKLILP